jgi:transcriptional regulator with XRE-family HTH domain
MTGILPARAASLRRCPRADHAPYPWAMQPHARASGPDDAVRPCSDPLAPTNGQRCRTAWRQNHWPGSRAHLHRCGVHASHRETSSEYAMTSLPQRIRRARARAGLSQTTLATRIGIRRSAVTQWEHPHGTRPSVEHLIRIAIETGTGFEWLATGRGPSELDPLDTTPALMVDDYAGDEFEAQALGHLRRMAPAKKRMAVAILETMGR